MLRGARFRARFGKFWFGWGVQQGFPVEEPGFVPGLYDRDHGVASACEESCEVRTTPFKITLPATDSADSKEFAVGEVGFDVVWMAGFIPEVAMGVRLFRKQVGPKGTF